VRGLPARRRDEGGGFVKQLALDIRLAEHAVFDSFFVGPNALEVARLRRMAAGDDAGVVWLTGESGSGKSHLLQASVAAAHAAGRRTAYLPLSQLKQGLAAVLDGLGEYDLVALDDLRAIAGDRDWELAVLYLYERLTAAGAALVCSAETTPAELGFSLADLSSRLCSGGIFRLEPLNDAECLQALQKRALWMGCELPEETGRYLLSRVDRNPSSLFELLDRLDRAALAAQKKLTVPFVRSIIDGARD